MKTKIKYTETNSYYVIDGKLYKEYIPYVKTYWWDRFLVVDCVLFGFLVANIILIIL